MVFVEKNMGEIRQEMVSRWKKETVYIAFLATPCLRVSIVIKDLSEIQFPASCLYFGRFQY